MTDENCEIPIVPPTITATKTSHETKGNTVPIITVKGSSEMGLQMDDVLGLPAVTSTENNSHESPNKEPVIAGFIPKVNYLIDYIEGAPSTILKTIQGHEPEPQVQKDFKDIHAIEVRRKIRVNTTKFSTQYLTQPMEIVINSPHLVDALRTVVTYYPMSIDSAPQTFRHPYRSLIHHIEELRTFGRDHPNNEHLDDTILHINLLLEVLAKDVLATLESEKKLHAYPTPTTTFENLWCIFKPGKDVYINDAVSGACVIKAVQRLSLNVRPPDSYFIECWRLRFDGSHYTPESHTFIIPSFKGERAITTLPVYPKEFCPKPSPGELPLDQQLVDRGHAIHELHRNSPAHREYNGLTLPGLGPCQKVSAKLVCFIWISANQ